jgi:hypothetical protein
MFQGGAEYPIFERVLVVSDVKEKLEEELNNRIESNNLSIKIDKEIFDLTLKKKKINPFLLEKPKNSEQIIEWQNLGFKHDGKLFREATQEVLIKYGLTENVTPNYGLILKIFSVPII